jgi:hypothetical protein
LFGLLGIMRGKKQTRKIDSTIAQHRLNVIGQGPSGLYRIHLF